MSHSETLKAAYVFLKHKGKGADKTGLKKWKKRWVYLRKDTMSGYIRIDHYDNEERAMKGKGCQTFSLKEALAVDDLFSKSQKYAFEIAFSNHSLACGVSSDAELRDWQSRLTISLFSNVYLHPTGEEMKAAEPTGTVSRAVSRVLTENEIEIMNNEHGLHGDYLLDITSDDELVLMNTTSGQIQVEWKLSHIRSFVLLPVKDKGSVLVMESGRRSSTGVGTFQFFTSQGETLYAYIHARSFRPLQSSDVPIKPVGPDIVPSVPPRRAPVIATRQLSSENQHLDNEHQDSVSAWGPIASSTHLQQNPDELHLLSLTTDQQESVSLPTQQQSSSGTSADDNSEVYYDSPHELVPRITLQPPVAVSPFATKDLDKYTTMKGNVHGYFNSDSDEESEEENYETSTDRHVDRKLISHSLEESESLDYDTYEPINPRMK
ncbi:uncharacterized protein LOC134178209 isoform X2 [Corticium candelabrum]|uniref:uncharacterized protein LOC134178209 isoform X2 n=1 Tax=Corticium candelabrum TaxID=121492 RepID=UPI002E25C421|nr:uncharacterized protein LOC134178209 isoform X2 [Corticium candelabrum]